MSDRFYREKAFDPASELARRDARIAELEAERDEWRARAEKAESLLSSSIPRAFSDGLDEGRKEWREHDPRFNHDPS